MQRNTLVKIGLTLLAMLLLSQAFIVTTSAQWDFPRLDELLFKIKYPYTVSLEAAKACEIDTYIGAIRTVEVETLRNPPYGWTVTAAPGFHMCVVHMQCRDVAPDTSGGRIDYHGRTPGFELYPMNVTAFRYALELMVGCNKTVWINDIYGYINVRLDTNIPPANVKWYNPSIVPYPLDWDEAYNQLIAAGFSGTVGGDDWLMPNGQPLREPIYAMTPLEAPTTVELGRRHVKSWNAFFCGVEIADPPHEYNFVNDITLFYDMIDIMYYNRDHDMGVLCWGLGRNPDYLWDFFHPDGDIPDGNNSPGLDYRPLNAMIDALKWCMYTEKTELRIYGPGPIIVPESTKYYTDYAFVGGSIDVWIGVSHGSGGYPYRAAELEVDVDYELIITGAGAVGIHFLHDIALGPEMYIHVCYELSVQVAINVEADLILLCYDIQDMLYYMCPYLPCYSRNYHDLYKSGLESWVPSLGYGSGAYQLKWTYDSIHWTGAPVGGTISWHLPGPVNTLHPYLATSVYEVTILNRLFDGMLEVDAYTHKDIYYLIEKYQIVDWTGPSGEPGMEIIYWTRQDIEWQDGDTVTADDWIWQYEFINSIRPSQLYSVWSAYHGCVKYNNHCFGVKTNLTGIWQFYIMSLGLVYPQKIWGQFWGDAVGAAGFRPWMQAYTDVVPPEKWGAHPPPTCLYGTGEWIYDYYDTTLGIIRVYKNPYYWMRATAGECRQVGCIHAPTNAKTTKVMSFDVTPYGKGTEWHMSAPWLSTTWLVTDYWDNGDGVVSVSDYVSLKMLRYSDGTPAKCGNRIVGHIMEIAAGVVKLKGWHWDNNVVVDENTGVAWQKVTKSQLGINLFNPDTKGECSQTWKLYLDYPDGTRVQLATGTAILAPLEQRSIWVSLPWQTLPTCLHTFLLETTNANGVNYYGVIMGILIADVDNNGIINMLDLYKTALQFGKVGPIGWLNEDIDNNGVINMLDLYICAVKFGTVCPNE